MKPGGMKPVHCVFCGDTGKVDSSKYSPDGKLLWRGEKRCPLCKKPRLFWRPTVAGALGLIPLIFVLMGVFTALINAKSTPLNLLGLIVALAGIYFFICLVLRFTVDEEQAETAPPMAETPAPEKTPASKAAKKVPARKRRG